jgi:pyruvate/2-oxoglutarate dehydrogenase complex dihydrolipoamide dehydrogenase (E3) component
MMKQIETDICIIGGGSGGLSLAAGAVQMGARVVLFEGGQMGGDCLNSGCVPSKALLAAAKAAYLANGNAAMGITNTPPNIDLRRLASLSFRKWRILPGRARWHQQPIKFAQNIL